MDPKDPRQASDTPETVVRADQEPAKKGLIGEVSEPWEGGNSSDSNLAAQSPGVPTDPKPQASKDLPVPANERVSTASRSNDSDSGSAAQSEIAADTIPATSVGPHPAEEAAVYRMLDLSDPSRWVLPGPTEAVRVTEGPLQGRLGVGDTGSQVNIRPTIWGEDFVGGHHPESVVDAGYVSPHLYVGAASLRGLAHHERHQPRQDHYSLGEERGWLIVAVADGVSQGRYSHLAAESACRAAVRAVRLELGQPRADWLRVSQAVRETVRRDALRVLSPAKAKGDRVDPAQVSDNFLARHMATTCDLLLVHCAPGADGTFEFFRVRLAGDSSCYVLDQDRGWYAVELGHDPTAEVIDTSVVPFPEDPGVPHVTEGKLNPGQVLVACTDGIGLPIRGGRRPVGRYLFQEWQQPRQATEMLTTLSFVNTNAHDDRTAVVVWTLKTQS